MAYVVHRLQRVRRLSRLPDGYDERMAIKHGVAVAELGGVFRRGGDAREFLDVERAQLRCVEARPHAEQHHAPQP